MVWDPLSGHQQRVPFPPGFRNADWNAIWQAAVLCCDAEDGHVHADCISGPFKLALICRGDTKVLACLYESTPGVWGNIVSLVATNTSVEIRPSVLVGNTVYWCLSRGDSIVFDIERQTLGVIEKPTDTYPDNYRSFQLLRIDDGTGLGLAVISKLSIHLWERKMNTNSWVLLNKIIQLEGMFPWRIPWYKEWIHLVGYDEDTNDIVLTIKFGHFILQLESMQTKKISEMMRTSLLLTLPQPLQRLNYKDH